MLEQIGDWVNRLVWGPATLGALLMIGIYYTVRSRFFPFRRLRLWWKETAGGFFRKPERAAAAETGKKGISSFQAMTAALAGAMGTGNIVGVAAALAIGGPGAIFWMWVAALFGMMTIFGENVLGCRYRQKNKKGEWVGGPMYYLSKGLRSRFLAGLFSVACIFSSFGMGNMTQANSIAGAIEAGFSVPHWATGTVLALLVGVITLGGLKRITGFTEKIVPFMSVFYLIGCLVVIVVHGGRLPQVLEAVFHEAFQFKAAAGGGAGFASAAVIQGISKGTFSNEAGLGSAPIIYAAAEEGDGIKQGMWGIFQVFADTIVGCTVTALCILASGVLDSGLTGVALSTQAFSSVFGKMGGVFVAVSIVMFAFATLVSWSYYGEKSLEYLAGERLIPIYRFLYAVCAALGCVLSLDSVWKAADTFNGLMAIPNMIALALLSREVFEEMKKHRLVKGGAKSSLP